MHWVDRATQALAPRWTLRRMRARAAAEIVARHYEAAAAGRRTQGWKRFSGDANAAIGAGGGRIRDVVRDLVRNNPYAGNALDTIVDHMVGWGIVGAPDKGAPGLARALAAWKAWAESRACDAEGRRDLAGLQMQVARTVVESGHCLVRRRWRRPSDNLPIPLQLQILEPDFLDTMRDGQTTLDGNQIIQGVEYDRIGRRVAYHLFRQHPGAQLVGQFGFGISDRIPASEVAHVFKPGRAGQVSDVPWFANVVLTMKDFDEYDDAQLMKQKIAACLGLVIQDVDGTAAPAGKEKGEQGEIDELYPGMILQTAPGRTVSTVEPPSVGEYSDYAKAQLRKISAGIGLTYEDLTGDYTGMPYSAARMSRIRHWARVTGWRWQMLIPQFCDPVWEWAMEAAAIMGLVDDAAVPVTWTAPPMAMIEPDKEGAAYRQNIRSGLITQSEALRERGYDPETFYAEMAEDNKQLDKHGLILDSDARRTTQAGLPREMPLAELAERIDALGGLIRAGYDPEAAAKTVGLGKLKHTGKLPVTVQAERGAGGPPAAAPPTGNGNGLGAAAKELAAIRDSVERALEFMKGFSIAKTNGHAAPSRPRRRTPIRDKAGTITSVIEEELPDAGTDQ